MTIEKIMYMHVYEPFFYMTFVCMYVRMYVYIYTYMYILIFLYTHTYIYMYTAIYFRTNNTFTQTYALTEQTSNFIVHSTVARYHAGTEYSRPVAKGQGATGAEARAKAHALQVDAPQLQVDAPQPSTAQVVL